MPSWSNTYVIGTADIRGVLKKTEKKTKWTRRDLLRRFVLIDSQMRKSNDPSESEPTYLGSLGVLDLDLTVCPHVFGLRAFDEKMPITRMLPGSSPCDMRLLIPDAGIGQDGFHDVVIENLLGTSTWRSKYVSPADVIGKLSINTSKIRHDVKKFVTTFKEFVTTFKSL